MSGTDLRYLVDEVKARVSIESVVGSKVQLRRDGSKLRGLCPFHEERTPSFTVYPSTNSYHCFGCHESGDVFSFLDRTEHRPFMEALRDLAQLSGVQMPQLSRQELSRIEEQRTKEDILTATALFYHSRLTPQVRQYLDSRGLTNETIDQWLIGYAEGRDALKAHLQSKGYSLEACQAAGVLATRKNGAADPEHAPLRDFYYNRVVFPNRRRGRFVGMIARALSEDAERKYLALPGTKEYLFNEDALTSPTVLLVEGPIDCIVAEQMGIRAVALTGTAFKAEYSARFNRCELVHVAFDGDAAGAASTVAVADALGDKARIITMPQGMDPDQYLLKYGDAAYDELAANAPDLITYLVERIPADTGKVQLARALEPVLARLAASPPPLVEAHLTDTIGRRFGLSSEDIAAYRELLQTQYIGPVQKRERPSPSISTGPDAGTDSDLRQREISEKGEISTPEWPESPKEAAFQGLAGEIVYTIDPHTESDPIAVLANLLVALGVAVGQGPHSLVAATRHDARTNLLLIGRSSKGRKGDSWPPVRSLFEIADPQWATNRVNSGLSSGEGLVFAVRDAVQKYITPKGATQPELTTIDDGVEDKRLLAIEPEFARVLQAMSRQGNTLNSVIRDAWDRSRLQVMTKGAPMIATGAHIGIIGHITVDELRRELTDTDAANGFANRFMCIAVKRSKELPEPEPFIGQKVIALAHKLRGVLEASRSVGRMERSPDARALWRAAYSDLSMERDGLAWAVLARAEAQVLRLSMLYALLDKSPVVQLNHLVGALELWGYSERSVLHVFGDATGDPIADAILGALQQRSSMTRTEISGLFQKHVKADRIEAALSLLDTKGKARMTKDATGGGRPVEMWAVDS